MGKEASYIDVLFEDNHIIAVNKPAGILVQADVSRDPATTAPVCSRPHESPPSLWRRPSASTPRSGHHC